jgi:GR25 family glycosyltransferase involved in LPS biosynthesis
MQFFDRICCINLDKRVDRWEKCLIEFERVGLQVERFSAFDGDNHHLAFNKSQHTAIKKMVEEGAERFLVLEDDVVFKGYSHVTDALNELPEDWDALWLGANINGTELERYSDHLFKLRNSFTTHAVGYSRKMAEWIVENFNPDQFPIYDEFLRINVQEQFKCFLVAPMVAWQRPDHSDIWGHHADYTSCFIEGNKLLK